MLEIVEQDEHLLVGDVLGDAVPGAEGLARGREDEFGVAQRSERDPPNAVDERVGGVSRSLQREPRLTHPTRTCQRHNT
ncbi:MAG: hypothetical protein ACXVRK_11660, partial [Gaiellaceae bacterium]